MFNEKSLGSIVLLIVTSLTACAPTATPTPQLTPVTVQLAWTHQAQFAGFYAADQNGYYAAEGLAVTFAQGGPNMDPIDAVLSATAQFGVSSADVLVIARSEGKAVRAIAVDYRRSPRVYIALAESGIIRPQDFVGKTISVNSTGRAPFEMMMKRVGIQPDRYTLVESPPDLASFYSSQVQVRSVYLNNEVLTARASGHKLNIIYPDDYGIHNYGDTLVATDDLIAKNPDLVRRFLRATLKGWTYAVENPTTIGVLVQKYNPNADAALENDKMTASIPLVNTGEDFIGWMKPEVWAGMEKTLREQSVLTKTVTITDVYTMQFLNEIYPSR